MKRITILAGVLVLLAATVGQGYSQIQITGATGIPGVASNGRMKFVKLASTDSTTVTIAVWGGAVTEAAAEDTTDWLDIGSYKLAQQGYTGEPMVQFQINHQIVASDSVGYKLLYANDPNDRTTFTAGSLTHVAGNAGGSTIIDAVAPAIASSSVAAIGSGARFIKLIILNDKIGNSAPAGRRYSVVPIVRGVK